MNLTESKTELLYAAIYKILKDDTVYTGKNIREMKYYVGDRIVRKHLRQNLSNPKILLEINENLSNPGLPSSKYVLTVTAVVNEMEQYALTTLDRIITRVEFLLNKQPTSVNLAVPGKNLRCRKIDKITGITSYDTLQKIHLKYVMFDIIVDDEILEC